MTSVAIVTECSLYKAQLISSRKDMLHAKQNLSSVLEGCFILIEVIACHVRLQSRENTVLMLQIAKRDNEHSLATVYIELLIGCTSMLLIVV